MKKTIARRKMVAKLYEQSGAEDCHIPGSGIKQRKAFERFCCEFGIVRRMEKGRCLAPLLGKRCRNTRRRKCPWCEVATYQEGFDHLQLWKTDSGQLLTANQPYTPMSQNSIRVLWEEWGLYVYERPYSWWCPGRTHLYVISVQEQPGLIDLGDELNGDRATDPIEVCSTSHSQG